MQIATCFCISLLQDQSNPCIFIQNSKSLNSLMFLIVKHVWLCSEKNCSCSFISCYRYSVKQVLYYYWLFFWKFSQEFSFVAAHLSWWSLWAGPASGAAAGGPHRINSEHQSKVMASTVIGRSRQFWWSCTLVNLRMKCKQQYFNILTYEYS